MGDVVDLRVNLIAAFKILQAKEDSDDDNRHKNGNYCLAGEVSGPDTSMICTFGISCAPIALCYLGILIGLTSSRDRKSTRLNSSHVSISYAVFCLKKKN